MKVNLAAQSKLKLHSRVQGMPQFDGCGPTVKFIRIFDRLFDVLNFRNPRANSFEAPIKKTNYEFVNKFLGEACEYIKGLKGPEDIPILKPAAYWRSLQAHLLFVTSCVDNFS